MFVEAREVRRWIRRSRLCVCKSQPVAAIWGEHNIPSTVCCELGAAGAFGCELPVTVVRLGPGLEDVKGSTAVGRRVCVSPGARALQHCASRFSVDRTP